MREVCRVYPNMSEKWKVAVVGLAIALSGFLFQISLQSVMRPYAKEGLYFQAWSSETLMQTVSIEDLRDTPLETLFNIHIQPPAFDVIRAILVRTSLSSDSFTALKRVDYLLYQLWALLYGLLGLVVFVWLFKLTGIQVAMISGAVFLLHPACMLYATLLDTTLLSSLLVLLMYYLLWRIKNKDNVSMIALAVTVLALFFTRSIFQWPFIVVLGFSLFLLGVPRRKLLLFLLMTGGVVGLYLGKQYYQFGALSTSSFTGLNLGRSVGIDVSAYSRYRDDTGNPETPESALPRALTRRKKIDGSRNFNHIDYLEINQRLTSQYIEHIRTAPTRQLAMSYRENLGMYFKPSSQYTKNVMADSLPWRSVYDRLFSFPILTGLIVLSGVLWSIGAAQPKDYMVTMGFVLPALCIASVSVLFEKGENMRFKFFVEPVLFVFVVAQLYATGQNIYQKVLTKRRT
jgi:hypothetical protein